MIVFVIFVLAVFFLQGGDPLCLVCAFFPAKPFPGRLRPQTH
jgi:hypothetical protein